MKESFKLHEDINESILDDRVKKIIPKNSVILKKAEKLVANYLSYCSIENDLEFVREAISKLMEIRLNEFEHKNTDGYEDKRLIEKRGLFIAILTSYSKCFNSNKGRVSLNEQFITKDFPASLLNKEKILDFHRKMIALRNKFIAHADESFYESTIGFMAFSIEGSVLNTTINYATGIVYSFNESELENMMILSAYLMKQVENKKKQLTDKIISKLSKEELISLGFQTIKTHINTI